MAQIKRIIRHLTSTRRAVNKAFPPKTLAAIEQAIQQAEATHHGEIRFVVEGALTGAPLLKGVTPRERAIDVFSQLRMWDTAQRTGVLIYLLMSDRQIEIVADRGIAAHVGHAAWSALCRQLEQAFKEEKFEQGAFACIDAVTLHLQKHFSTSAPNPNELSNAPVLM
jgi:uncharacterized membrane protein